MIEGLKLELKGAELIERIGKRAAWHKAKYDKTLTRFGELYVPDKTKREVEADRRHAVKLEFYAKHLDPEQTYRLSTLELEELELLTYDEGEA